MNLFPYEPTLNLLPFDGIANYYGPGLWPSTRSLWIGSARKIDQVV
jgi:hypothetical protein